MDIFGGWKGYQNLLEQNWRERIAPEDTVVLAGDFSWGMTLAQSEADFAFVQKLPGQKILLKGNHDYWWTSKKKMEDFFVAHGFDTMHILHNNHYAFGNYGICGTRGWVSMQERRQMPRFWREKFSGCVFPFNRQWMPVWNLSCSCTIRRSTAHP